MLILWKRFRQSERRNPLTRDLLRSPGEYLREQIDDLNWDLASLFAASTCPASVLYGFYLSSIVYDGKELHPALFIIAGVAIHCWLIYKMWALIKKRRQLTLGYEAELAVGQELNQLARHQYHVFHDIPADRFNVDHVLVGPNGVFAVETKGRSKPTKDGKATGWEVTYDGNSLGFPGWTESKPLQQAQDQAKWLREWLSSAVGEPVSVLAILALPGWKINRTTGSGIPVISGRNPEKYIPKINYGPKLSEQLIQRIFHQLDQRCRDVSPQAYAPLKND